jgi:muramoyltetrapeptide carboxypeptidase LdcA involved in peptidoglycan recycling
VKLVRPPRLKPGDTMATVSLSSGFVASIPHRYQAGKRQVEETFGLRVVEAPNSQRGAEFLYRNPQARVDDLIWALTEPNVAGIISNIGGTESVRLLPLLGPDVIRRNPKIFMGYSDTTIQHVAFFNAGVVSFYGPSLLTDLAENCGIHPYTADSVRRTLFSAEPVGDLKPSREWTEQYLEWADPSNQARRRIFRPNPGWTWLQGTEHEPVEGHLLGGCIEVLEMLKGTPWWPAAPAWKGAVLYFETSEEVPEPSLVERWLRSYASQGILQVAVGLLLARPYGYSQGQKRQLFDAVRKVLSEIDRTRMPVIADMDCGHTSPLCVLPNGCRVRIDPAARRITLLEAGVQ